MTDEKYWRGKPGASVSTYRQACFDLALANVPRIVVEVGVYAGGLSRKLATLPTLERLYLVDSWEGSTEKRQPPFYMPDDQERMNEVAASVKTWAAITPKVTVMHMSSAEAAEMFDDASVDFVHTDGDHTLAGITTDIVAWLPKVRTGGILSGDNYEMPTVAAGVDKRLPKRQLAANGRLWWYRK